MIIIILITNCDCKHLNYLKCPQYQSISVNYHINHDELINNQRLNHLTKIILFQSETQG